MVVGGRQDGREKCHLYLAGAITYDMNKASFERGTHLRAEPPGNRFSRTSLFAAGRIILVGNPVLFLPAYLLSQRAVGLTDLGLAVVCIAEVGAGRISHAARRLFGGLLR
jgi:hypothetical protein